MTEEYIWYVCYGSNLCYERFMCYLTGEGCPKYGVEPKPDGRCENPNPPKKSAVTIIPFPLYFARESRIWEGKGVAFIDPSKKGISIGKAYLVTREQYLHVKAREGRWYEKEVKLSDIEGIPAYTFTDRFKHPFVAPSEKYKKVILDGLVECGIHPDGAVTYIKSVIKNRTQS